MVKKTDDHKNHIFYSRPKESITFVRENGAKTVTELEAEKATK